ncbi:aminopeptidase N-like [Lineus longissimus]|uniref:aminopeptidase N-like n=1 Tax=Lineus longissimus TaxID=88925 RepID=UPI002B4E24D5
MVYQALIFVCFFGLALAVLPHPDLQQRNRYKRYAPAKNNHNLLQDTLVPIHYDLTIRPDIYQEEIANFNFEGNVTIHFKCRRPTNRIKLHVMDLHIIQDDVHLSGGQGRFKVTSMDTDEERSFVTFRLNRRLKKGDEYTISIVSFTGKLVPSLNGLYLTGYVVNGTRHYMAITQMEPNYARRMFPCFDEPALKATFSITVLRRSSHVALSNMPQLKSELLENGWFADTFDKTPVMPTYLVAIAITDYKFTQGYTKDGIKVRVWWREEELDKTKLALETAIKTTEWFTEYTGINYTLPKMDHIAVPDFAWGGMENWGLITYAAYCLPFDPKVDDSNTWETVTGIIIHEVAHQWFGNLVTAKWWNDIWINEAMTSFMTFKSTKDILPGSSTVEAHVHKRRQAFFMDGYHDSHPIDYSVVRQSELDQVFDSITYVKGSLVLQMMEGVIGEKEFQHGVQIFLQTHQFGNADQYDLYDAFNEALQFSDQLHLRNVDVGEFMATWIQQAGYPVLTILHDETGLKLNQSRYLVDPKKEIPDKFKSHFGGLWVIPLFISTNATGEAVQTPPIWMHGAEVELSTELDFTNNIDTTWILGNHGMKGYYIVNYDESNWKLLAEQLIKDHTVIPPINRAEIIYDTVLLVKSGELHVSKSLELARYLKNEKDSNPWTAFINAIERYGDKLQYTDHYGVLRTYILELIGHMYSDDAWDVATEKGITNHRKELMGLILATVCHYDYKPCLKKAQDMFKDATTTPIPAEARRTVYCSVVKSSTVDTWDKVYAMYLHEYQKNGGVYNSLVNDITLGLSCSREEWVLRRYLELELDRGSNVYTVFSNVAKNPVGGRVALKIVLERWNETRENYVLDSVCEKLSTKEDQDMLLEWLEKNPKEKDGSHKYFIEQALEVMQTNIDWLQNDGKKVIDWLNEIYEDYRQEGIQVAYANS